MPRVSNRSSSRDLVGRTQPAQLAEVFQYEQGSRRNPEIASVAGVPSASRIAAAVTRSIPGSSGPAPRRPHVQPARSSIIMRQ